MAVTIGLRISDGTTTVTISNGTTGWLIDYMPQAKPSTYETVNEQATALLLSTLSTARATVESINRLCDQARNYQREKAGACVYIERQLDTTEDWWRSELTDGYCYLTEKSLDGGTAAGKVETVFSYTRRNYWEGAESQVSLTNGSATDNTSGITIYNHDDSGSGHDNWVTITAAKVSGDLPAPTRIEMTATDATTGRSIAHLWIGQNWTDPGNFTHILEAENATGGSSVVDADCSGGSYRSASLASGAEGDLFTWTLDSTAQAAAAGRWYRPLVVFRVSTSGAGRIADTAGTADAIQYRMKIKDLGVKTLFQGARVYKTGELAPIRIPTQLIGQTGLASIQLVLTGYQTTGSSKTVDVDFVELQPLDGWRKVVMTYDYITNGYRLIDDGFKGITYGDSGAGSGKTAAKGVYGSPIMLYPNKLQKLYFLWQSDYYSSAGRRFNASTATLKLYYRPRRLTIN